jgi:hypothetical protein
MIRALCILAACNLAFGAMSQVTQDAQPSERGTATRIARLADMLDPDNPASVGAEHDDEYRDKLAAAIRGEVTNFVEGSVPASSNQETIQARLRAALGTQRPSLEHGELPKARVATLRYGRSLVISYAVVRPPHFDSSLIFGFREDGGGFRQVATTGEDFDGYTMFSFDVASPVNGELWLLVGGRAHTFNGLAKYRYRVYSFNGDAFATIWSRDDVFNATLQVSPRGFAITHTDRTTRSWAEVVEEYAISANGIFKVK